MCLQPWRPCSGGTRISGSRRLDAATHRRAVSALARDDRRLAGIVRRHGVPDLKLRRPGFATLVQIILEQQVSVASGLAVWRKLVRLTGGVRAGNVARLDETRLGEAGLSRQKARYVASLARVVESGALNMQSLSRRPDDAVRARLMEEPGIGLWTADVYLLLALGRPDVWPAGDLALQVAQAEALGLDARPGHDESHALADAWRPWRSVAARILWHGYVRDREAKRGA